MKHSLWEQLDIGLYDNALIRLYGENSFEEAKKRFLAAAERFTTLFVQHRSDEAVLYSAPGRTEVGGNHTDHQHGRVLAAAINLDIIGIMARNDERVIRVCSEGFSPNVVSLDELEIKEEETGSSNALIRGIAKRFEEMGYVLGGFDLYTTSQVLKGSGLSSSAAFEVLIGTILSHEYAGGQVDAVEIAKIGQYAENVYFGKASGLMDQMVSSVGSFVGIDFKDPQNPVIEKIPFDFKTSGYQLCITDTKGSHADLTPDYVAVPTEMRSVAACFGKEVLRQVEETEFYEKLPELKTKVSDRALLRAIHFFHDNENAQKEAQALKAGDIAEFLSLVRASGKSSYEYLQNIYSTRNPQEQGIALALAVSEEILQGEGACRVHGGGFAGTIQAFVPQNKVDDYRRVMDQLFGEGSCHLLQIREAGGVKLLSDSMKSL
jgi:galactokinase